MVLWQQAMEVHGTPALADALGLGAVSCKKMSARVVQTTLGMVVANLVLERVGMERIPRRNTTPL